MTTASPPPSADLVVAFTVSGLREKYLKKALESWAKARGIESVLLLFSCEPQPTFPLGEFEGWARRSFARVVVVQNDKVYGCLNNTRAAFSRAFDHGARLAVMAEEDLVVSAGVLEYLSWAALEYEQDSGVAAVCAHVKESKSKDDSAVVRAPWFNPLVCGTWRDRWENMIAPTWRAWEEGMHGNQAWDNNLRQVLRHAGKVSIFPARSRVTHIGETSTIYGSPVVSEFMFRESISGCFSTDHRADSFREVPFESVPSLLV